MVTHDVVIIGSGPAGLTAAVYAARANLKTVVVAGDTWGGQLMLTTEVENFPGFPEGIMGPELMGHMRKQAERFGVKVIDRNAIALIQNAHNLFEIDVDNEEKLFAKAVILAMGADTQWLGVPGEQELIGRGVSSCAPCDAAFFRNKRVMVVGGGDSAMEEALVLTKFASEVLLVHRRDAFRASKIMQERVLSNPKVRVLWDSQIVKMEGTPVLKNVAILTGKSRFDIDGSGYLDWAKGRSESADNETVLWHADIDGVFVAIGHTPNTSFVKNFVELDTKGYIQKISSLKNNAEAFIPMWLRDVPIEEIVGKFPSLTSREGVFVAGDIHDHHYRQAVTAAAFGCMATLDCERWLQEYYPVGR